MQPKLNDYLLAAVLTLTLGLTWYYMYLRHADATREHVYQCMVQRGDVSQEGYDKCLQMRRTR